MSSIRLSEDEEEQQLYEYQHENTAESPLLQRSQSHESIISTLSAPPAYELYPPATTIAGRVYNFFRRIPTRFTQSNIALPTLSSEDAETRSISSRFRIPQIELHPRLARWRYPIIGLCACCITIFSFLLFCSIYFSPASLPDPSVPDKVANDTAKFLSLNIFMRPPGVKNNWSDYKDDRLDYIIRHILPQYDVISFQEAFAFGTRRKDRLIVAARELGFNHHIESARRYPWQIAIDGGLLVLSRFPIKESHQVEYPRGRHSDWLARKGAIHALIECKPENQVHIYTTHTQASYGPIESLFDEDVNVRMMQLEWLHSLVAVTSKNDKSAIILNGDLNVDAAIHDENTSPSEPSEKSSQEYDLMMEVLSGKQRAAYAKYDNQLMLNLTDAVYHSYGYHPVTYADVRVDENGLLMPAETTLTDQDDLMSVQSIDHILWDRRESPIKMESVRVEKFLTSDTKWDEDEDPHKGFSQVSVIVDSTRVMLKNALTKAPKVIFSGIQPTGTPHLGNYLGALQNWVQLQRTTDATIYYSIVDLHAITMPQDPKVLRRAKLDMAISLLACGVDVERSVLFEQSKVKEHAELQWIFNCITPVGWLSRMTQWKSKLGANTLPSHSHSLSDETLTSGLKMGLLDYPVLQAADILLYKATHVPIGEDQLQHLELARDIGSTFNKTFKTKLFPLPEGIVPATTKRIMSLRNPSAKMSKSDPSDQSRINLTDTADMIKSKLARAQTDSIRGITYDPVNRPGVSNLLSIQAELEGRTIEQVVDDSKSISSNKEFKDRVTEVVIESLLPIQAEIKRLENDLGYVQNVLDQGAHRARSVATVHLDECYKLIGLK